MKSPLIANIISQMLASYAMRELDRVWLDRFMSGRLGLRLKKMPNNTKNLLEFLAYLSSACFAQTGKDASAIRHFADIVLTHLPPEIAKRMMMDTPDLDVDDLREMLDDLSDQQLMELAQAGKSQEFSENINSNNTIDQLTSNLSRFRQNLKTKRTIIKPQPSRTE